MRSASCFLFLLFPLLFISCTTTRVYEKTTQQIYQNDELIGEQSVYYYSKGKNIKTGKRKITENSGKYLTSYDIDFLQVEAETEYGKTPNSQNIKIALYHNDSFIEEREYEVKNKKVIHDSSKLKSAKSEKEKYQDLIDYGDYVIVEGDESIDTFIIAKTEVTEHQYAQVMKTSLPLDDKIPKTNVSFFEAIEFCNALSIKEGLPPVYRKSGNSYSFDMTSNGYRLPTVKEWQYAANGGKFKNQYKYAGSNSIGSVGWYKSNSGKKVHPVAKKKPNNLGIYDMIGNADEWCWGDKYYACGGSYTSKKDVTIDKIYYHPNNSRYNETGFRVVRSLSKEEKNDFLIRKNIIENLDEYFSRALDVIINSDLDFSKIDDSDISTVVSYERTVVESSPNAGYVFYSILGKPFVILGSTALNILKSLGYAFINFIGGYHTIVFDDFFWLMPNVSKARSRARIAGTKNLGVYPEYHIPFTNNRITVNTITGKTESYNSVIDPNEIRVTGKDVQEYNNSMSIKLSAEKDAYETASIIGVVGTALSVPISAVSWFFGVLAGLCSLGR